MEIQGTKFMEMLQTYCSYPTLPLSCTALPCFKCRPALPCFKCRPALPCFKCRPALPCPALPCPALPCPALPQGAAIKLAGGRMYASVTEPGLSCASNSLCMCHLQACPCSCKGARWLWSMKSTPNCRPTCPQTLHAGICPQVETLEKDKRSKLHSSVKQWSDLATLISQDASNS